MPDCFVCHHETDPGHARTITSGERVLHIHDTCYSDFGALLQNVMTNRNLRPANVGLEKLTRSVGGRLILIHRNFPNEQMPLLAFLAQHEEPTSVDDVYQWLQQNEVNISNPANQVLRLKNKGLISALQSGESRQVMITDEGRKVIEEYAKSIG
jgi:hypothetical protein